MGDLTAVFVVAGYLGLLIALGIITSRLFRGTASDYFVVSRSVGPFLLFMSIFGTTMTGFALVGSTGKAYSVGIGVYGLMASWSGIVHSAVFFLVGIRLWAIGKRHGYLTQCEFFRERFESPALGFLLFFVLVGLVIPYLLVGIISAGKAIQPITAGAFPDLFPVMLRGPDGAMRVNLALHGGVPMWLGSLVICAVTLSYIFFGGLRGAIWANTFQTLVFMLTGVVTFILIANKLGGLESAIAAVSENPQAQPLIAREGLIPPLQFLTYGLVPLSVGMFPHLFQHWLTAKSARSFRMTVIAHPICIMIVWAPCVLIGVWAAGQWGAGVDPNTVLGRMVNQLVHVPWLSGLLGAGILAAIMSSLDSQFVCMGTMFTQDIVGRFRRGKPLGDRQKIWFGRLFVMGIVIVSYFLSLFFAKGTHVFDLGVWCFSGFASLFPLVFAALYWKRATKAGAIASVLAAVFVWLVLFIRDMIQKRDGAPGQSDELLLWSMMPVTFIFLASAGSLILVSFATRPPSSKVIQKFFVSR